MSLPERFGRSRGIECLALFLALVAPACLQAQSAPCAKLQTAKAAAYGFEPSRLSDQQRKDKSREMDEFWNTARSMGQPGVTCLQHMLTSERSDAFFLFDASSLLLLLDTSPASLEAASGALLHTDLKDVDTAGYLRVILGLSQKGADIGPLAEKYMIYPSVDTYLPEHGAMKLTRADGALILYGSMKPDLAEKYLEALALGKDANARPAAALALALNLTQASFRAFHTGISLDGVASDDRKMIESIVRYHAPEPPPNPTLSREQVLKRVNAVIRGDFDRADESNPPYVAGDAAFETSAPVRLTPADLPLVFEARRKSVRGVSDESLDEYMSWSHTILEVVNRNDLYKDLRAH
jgi:hypothetical protein